MEEIFHELPSWEATNFAWMIAWRREYFFDDEVLHDCHHSYLEEAMCQQEGFHISLPFFQDESPWAYSPQANTFAENLKQRRRLWIRRPQEGGKFLKHPCSFLRTRKIWEKETVIFPNYLIAKWNINFCQKIQVHE